VIYTFPTWSVVLLFTVGGIIVWRAGTSLARLADTISDRTGLSHVLAGAMLLGVATSLPEIATGVVASYIGNASLAVHNVYGGVAMQIAVLALIDYLFVRNGPLTFFSPAPVLLLGGVFLIIQIGISIAALAVGDIAILGHVGMCPLMLASFYVVSLYYMNHFSERDTWTPAIVVEPQYVPSESAEDKYQDHSTSKIYALFAMHCLLVCVGGWAVSTSADALSQQTGIGSGFLGATFVALTTSLPEISTTAGAVRLGSYTIAISNIFGTNILELALLLPNDLVYTPGPVINAVGQTPIFLASLGIVMTAFYLWGLLERRDRAIGRMGMDSWLVTITYLAGLSIIYFLPA